jgi:hypothetical protein
MPEDEEIVQLDFTLADRLALIKAKTIVLKKLLDEKKEILGEFKPGEQGFNREEWSKKYNQNLTDIQKITKDLGEELSELASFKRKQRFTEWPAWWNLWVGGFIVALVVNLLDWLWDIIQVLLKNLNNPEKVLEIALKVLNAFSKP